MASRIVCWRAGQVARAAGEQRQAAGEAGQQRRGREELDPGGGQLDRQRQPVEAGADRGDRRRVRLVEREAGADRAGPADEEPRPRRRSPADSTSAPSRGRADRAAAPGTPARRRRAGPRGWWPGSVELRAVRQQRRDLRRGRRPPAPGCRAPGGAGGRCRAAASRRVNGRSPRSATPSAWAIAGSDEGGIAHGGEGDEGDAVAELAGQLGGEPEREAGLADAAGAGQGDEADAGRAQQRRHGGELALPPDQRRQRHAASPRPGGVALGWRGGRRRSAVVRPARPMAIREPDAI